MYRQGIPAIELFIEQDTENTPEPQKFYVIHKGRVLTSFATLKAATKKYKEVKDELGYIPPPPPKADAADLAKAIQDDLMNRKEQYWSNSTSFRTTNKKR